MSQPSLHNHACVWFEIPVTNLARSAKFYEDILQVSLKREAFGPGELAVFPTTNGKSSGCLMHGASTAAGSGGTVVYLSVDGQLDQVLARTETAGGKIVLGKTALPDNMGSFARIRDCEGNTIGLHAA